jgi:hypothetical protein
MIAVSVLVMAIPEGNLQLVRTPFGSYFDVGLFELEDVRGVEFGEMVECL